MAIISYSAQFQQIYVDNAAGTPVELSDYAESITGTVTYDDRDGTTFKAGGGAIAEYHGRGALAMTLDVGWLYHKNLAKHLRQIYASIAGFTVQARQGSNAAPTFGDEVWQGEFTFFSVQFAPTPGQDVKLRTQFLLAQGATVPVIGRY